MSRYVLATAPTTPGSVPANQRAELDVVACCLQRPEYVDRALAANVNVEAFVDSRCHWIWPSLAKVYLNNTDVDVSIFVAELGPLSQSTKRWIVDLARGLPMRSHWPIALGRLLEARRKRDLVSAAHRIIEAVRAGESSGDIIAAATKTLTDIGESI